jgi:hypothetical protein
MLLLVFASMFSPLLKFAKHSALLMLNVVNMLLTTNCPRIAKLQNVTQLLALVFLQMIPQQIAKNANLLVSQAPTATLQNVSGLEQVINVNIPLRIVMMANHLPLTLVILPQVNAITFVIAPLLVVILTLIVHHGEL